MTIQVGNLRPVRRPILGWWGPFRRRCRGRAVVVIGLVFGFWAAGAAEVRWSESSSRIYVSGPGRVTLSDLKALAMPLPLKQISPGVWHLRASLILDTGAELRLHGTGIGGDVDELRLQSNNTTNAGSCVALIADWGSIHIQDTSISSWDDAAGGPDVEYENYGRAYIGVRSRLAPDGVTPLESRMDIIHSRIGYLGYDDAETYGLVWKVVGEHPDPTKSIYDYVNVYGDILNSRLHHNFFGMYSFGHQGGHWATNEVDHNVGYGFDPHDDSDNEVIEANDIHHNGWDGLIASKRCDHLTIRGNVSRANGQNGIILHRSCNDSLVENNQCLDNGTTGIVLTGDWRCVVRSNLLAGNSEAGLRLDLGGADNVVQSNVCLSNRLYGFYLYKGSDTPEHGDDGRPKRNLFSNNLVTANVGDAIELADSDDNTFASNSFVDNGNALHFERGFRNVLESNAIPSSVVVNSLGSPFDAVVTYVRNQPSLRVQLDAYSTMVFEDALGQIFDPEENGVATQIAQGGSTLTLTGAEIGTTSTVVARSLWSTTSEGTAWLNPTAWTGIRGSPRKWVTQGESPNQSLTYTVGDLEPNWRYKVRKAGLLLMQIASDSMGRLTFTDVAGTTDPVPFSIEQTALQVFLRQRDGSLIVSWTGGKLQRTTTFFPANWQDVPLTNGQFSLHVDPAQPIQFFRSTITEGNIQ